MAFLQK